LRHNDVNREPHQLGSQFRDVLEVVVAVAVMDDQIPAGRVSERDKGFAHCSQKWRQVRFPLRC